MGGKLLAVRVVVPTRLVNYMAVVKANEARIFLQSTTFFPDLVMPQSH